MIVAMVFQKLLSNKPVRGIKKWKEIRKLNTVYETSGHGLLRSKPKCKKVTIKNTIKIKEVLLS